MPLRRSHVNSHHGCAQCKQRRIKCNEARPICISCHKKKIKCSFNSIATPTTPPHRTGGSDIRVETLGYEISQLQLLDLELLNHWHVATVQTLVHDISTEKVLREFVPQVALSHPFLMHSLLALSALHLSHHGPVERRHRYTEAAMTHNNISLSLCTPMLNNVTPENCHALFAFACFVAMFSFAAHGPKVNPRAQSVSDVLEVFKLVRGVASVVAQARPWIEAGGMRDLLQVGRQPRQMSKTTHVWELYARIRRIHDQVRPAVADCYVGTGSVVATAAEKLLDLLQLSTTMENPGSTVMRWPAVVDLQYLDLLLEDNAIALVVLAHYGVALDMMIGNWWMDGWGTFLVHLALDRLGPDSGPELAWVQEAINRGHAASCLPFDAKVLRKVFNTQKGVIPQPRAIYCMHTSQSSTLTSLTLHGNNVYHIKASSFHHHRSRLPRPLRLGRRGVPGDIADLEGWVLEYKRATNNHHHE
ncbi:hypothetical protein BO78DRAFT_473177 [Aspergillus sclerotiicarbonarius CBS 121057]|uniref:Zn(2)-C6 fungal-type domain-containing protein n=1 Tax=Aspergillus sclerotiicarbonarius (strain CBS 121057 / IBT 28362) TaxID=1448318 RepID=A0A319DVC3_ASPSB|nr:hypothetical protein BO78DRAFT_473177 [Aspergillus sclerotiicarbonarius CBS 121057]